MLKKTIMISAAALLCAMPAMAKDGVISRDAAGVEIAQAQGGADARKLIGRNVQNMQNETIGEIESVHLDANGKVDLVIIGVGGFLGVGERNVAINWSDLQITNNGEKVAVNMTKDQLKARPEYRYAEPRYRGTVFGDSRTAQPDDRRTMIDQAAPRNGTVTTPAGQVAVSALVGANVKNAQNETIGTIDDVLVDANGTAKSVVVSVGGFLGMGSRHVNLPWTDVQVQRDGDKNKLIVMTNATKDQLKAMPEYKYKP